MKDFKFLKKPLHERIHDIVIQIGEAALNNDEDFLSKHHFRDEVKIQYLCYDFDMEYETITIQCTPYDELGVKILIYQYTNDEWVYDSEYVM